MESRINNVENAVIIPNDMLAIFLTGSVNMFPGSERGNGRKFCTIWKKLKSYINEECIIEANSEYGELRNKEKISDRTESKII